MSEPFELTVVEAEAGRRLDKVLSARDLGVSRSALQRWIEEGRVQLDGEVARAKDKPRVGSVVRVAPAPPEPSEAVPQDIPLDIAYEDDHLLVVHKPAGLVVHPAPGHPDGTLVNGIRFHCEIKGGEDPRRPGIVHRLDRDTSGLMVVAKTDAAREALMAQFKDHSIDREYVAIACGDLAAPMTFETLHGRHPTDRKRFTGKVTEGKRAVTHMRPLLSLPGATLVACTLETGRTHQIRVHLSEAGHPILGDPVYGRRAPDALVEAEGALGRLALHARVLGFSHPASGERTAFRREPPPDFMRALSLLGVDQVPA